MRIEEVSLGVRIPVLLKEKLDHFCEEHGLKMSHVVKTALMDKLREFKEELEDIRMAKERLRDGGFFSQEEYDRYLKKRLRKK